MIISPVELLQEPVRLVPLAQAHEEGLRTAAADGELWNLVVTSAPEPEATRAYIDKALSTPDRLAFAVLDAASGQVLGTTSFHDIVPEIDRLEIGYTWYAQSCWRTPVNTACKLALLRHAFDELGAAVVGWRTDILNTRSQAAIERLGARKDGVIRHDMRRRDGTVRDTVRYSLLAAEWPAVREHLEQRLQTVAI